ncbi:MAG: hypothetical protein JWO67_838 [Streptosporangiaceae bacterium]|nr:hypothetical protein [Streptosporangiaceae bacterium]
MMLERLREVLWLLDYLDDVESDMSSFHRVDDIYEMDAPRFFRLAVRLTAYQGVLAARRMAEEQNNGQNGPSTAGTEAREVQSTRSDFAADPALSSLVSWGSA